MTPPQPRDNKGRFANTKGQSGDIILIIAICAILATFVYFGYTSGYEQGYEKGTVDVQPDIYQKGFDAGMEKQKNAKGFEDMRVWVSTYSWDRGS